MKHALFLILLLVVAVYCCRVAGGQTARQTKNQTERLKEIIEESIGIKQRKIENSYQYQLGKLLQWTEEQIRVLRISDRVIASKFTRIPVQTPYIRDFVTIRTVEDIYVRHPVIRKATSTVSAAPESHFVGIIRPYQQIDDVWPTFVSETPLWAKEFINSGKVRQLRAILEEFQFQAELLERRKESRLAKLEKWKWEKIESLSKAYRDIKPVPKKPKIGTVTAVSCGPGPSLVMIEGLEPYVFQQGSTAGGISIIKIHRHKVDFKLRGRKWSQKLGQAPDRAWSKLNYK
ncbi:MAG: hypothetical protein ACYS71_03175 [Planctomycetota bacterium]|jgi:hypothetical protein